ncbi:MAG TPA: transaldolase [Chloroflexi bacterium]|jgi:transaldolase|nr:transaldolase [Chloroflexota bacterium]
MTDGKNTLHQLLEQGQSPWIDNITRDMLQDGTLRRLVDVGIVGLTSNPTIFQKAIAKSTSYDEELQTLTRQNKSVQEIFDDLVLDDIGNAADVLRPVYDRMNGGDGFVSIEVPPNLSADTEATIQEVRRLFNYLARPNVFVKVPGTPEGIPAFQKAISEGININVTLLFSLESYRKVAEAYLAGLEQRASTGQPIDGIASVASFFVSRVDTAVDKKLDAMIGEAGNESRKSELQALKGKAAIANAKMAYEAFKEIFSGSRWEALAAKGARVQRCLWASTSTKNPDYRDVVYVEQLIGPDTVDTMPDATIDAFLDHGKVERTLDRDVDTARKELQALENVGISMDEVTHQLQVDGVKSFTDSFNEMLETINSKREQMLATA